MNAAPNVLARTADLALEGTIAGSFTRVGFQVRRALADWTPLESYNLSGKTVLVTGATSGLGREAATTLAKLGAEVIVLGRNPERTADVAQAIGARAVVADLADLEAVRAVAAELTAELDGLDVLINNAGALTHEFQQTDAGLELTYQTHVVAPFLLTSLLLPLLQQRPGSRVITVSSGGMYTQKLDLATLDSDGTDYDGVTAYAKAKRAQVVLNRLWAAKYPAGPEFHAMHPGWADTPGVVDSLPGFHRVMGRLLRTPEQGSDTMVWLAATPDPGAGSGSFWLDRRPRGTNYLPWTRTSLDDAKKLWDRVSADAGLS